MRRAHKLTRRGLDAYGTALTLGLSVMAHKLAVDVALRGPY